MAVREIVQADDPSLRHRARRVKRFDRWLDPIIEDMMETMHAASGVGLAAPQIGVPLRIVVVQLPEDEEEPTDSELHVLLNPEVVSSTGEEEGQEGCLSFPGYVGEVKRATSVTVKARDRRGKEVRIKAEGFFARVLQHEIDHLDGLIYVDRLESLDRLHQLPPPEEGEPQAQEI